jgi:hypothetical protein
LVGFEKLDKRSIHFSGRSVAILFLVFSLLASLVSCNDTPQTPDDQLPITEVAITKAVGCGDSIEVTNTFPTGPNGYEYNFYWDFAGSQYISDWKKIITIPGYSFEAPGFSPHLIDPILNPTKDTTIFYDTSVVFYGRWERSVLSGHMEKFKIATPSIAITYY